jgi:hypothetical protein
MARGSAADGDLRGSLEIDVSERDQGCPPARAIVARRIVSAAKLARRLPRAVEPAREPSRILGCAVLVDGGE